MKLIESPTCNVEQIEIKQYSVRSLIRHAITLGGCPPTDKDVIGCRTIPGRTTYTNALIDFEVATDSESLIGTKLDCIMVGGKLLFGVTPILNTHDNVYECTVDHL